MGAYTINGIVRDVDGVPVDDALVYVFDPDAGLADLFNDLGSPIANPLATNEVGYYEGFTTGEGFFTLKTNYGGRERYVEERLIGRDPIERAEDAAGAAEAFTGPTYPDMASGLAATQDGDFFAVNNGGIVTVYLNDAGVAVAQRTMATTDALAATTGAALVGSDDGAGGSLWTTLAGFVARLMSAAGSNVIGFIQAGTGAAARTTQAKLRDVVSVKDYGATGDGATDDAAAIQACFDANPNACVVFPYGNYICGSTITLVNASGRDFQGDIRGDNATVTFTNAGNASDSDISMQRGFAVYPTLNGVGGDITGMRQSKVSGITIVGPLHGSGFHLANSQSVTFSHVQTQSNRYGIVNECCIHTQYDACTFSDYTNAGVALVTLGDTARVWYGPVSYTASYWNDSPAFYNCNWKNSLLTQPLAHILDHGSFSESVRVMEGCLMYSRWDEIGPFIGVQYGILARNANWSIKRSWSENVNYPIRILDATAVEGTGNVSGVAGAEPAGTYSLTNFPDGFSYNLKIEGFWFARGYHDIDCSGVRGKVHLDGNVSQLLQNGGQHITSITPSTAQIVLDDGAQLLSPVGTYAYSSFVAGRYVDTGSVLTSWTPTVSASSGAITSYTISDAKYWRRGKWVQGHVSFLITDNGTGAGAVQITPPVTAATRGGSISGRETDAGGKVVGGQVDGSQMIIVNYDNTYPGATNARFALTFQFEAA